MNHSLPIVSPNGNWLRLRSRGLRWQAFPGSQVIRWLTQRTVSYRENWYMLSYWLDNDRVVILRSGNGVIVVNPFTAEITELDFSSPNFSASQPVTNFFLEHTPWGGFLSEYTDRVCQPYAVGCAGETRVVDGGDR